MGIIYPTPNAGNWLTSEIDDVDDDDEDEDVRIYISMHVFMYLYTCV